jgi:hypothetical protein
MENGIAQGGYTGIDQGVYDGDYTGVNGGLSNGLYNENRLYQENINLPIVRNGLVIHLDAANKNSYSGSGARIWRDISGNNNNAVLNGNSANPVWNSLGFWNFPASTIGVNGGMIISSSASLNTITDCTIEIYHTLETKSLVSGDSDWMCIFSKSSNRNDQAPAISINQGATGNRYLHIERPSTFNSANNTYTDYTGNKWYCTVAVISSTSFGYLNNVQISTSAGGILATSFSIHLGYDTVEEMFKGKLGIIRMYNRALSVQELTQNFNVTRSRFGL